MRRPWHLTQVGAQAWLLEPSEGLNPADGGAHIEGLTRVLLQTRPQVLYYDVKDVAVVDEVYFAWLSRLHRGCALLGVDLVVLHMRPETAYALSRDLSSAPLFTCAQSLSAMPAGWSRL